MSQLPQPSPNHPHRQLRTLDLHDTASSSEKLDANRNVALLRPPTFQFVTDSLPPTCADTCELSTGRMGRAEGGLEYLSQDAPELCPRSWKSG
jgi:hypothetical protein